jgi:hypothetical protein
VARRTFCRRSRLTPPLGRRAVRRGVPGDPHVAASAGSRRVSCSSSLHKEPRGRPAAKVPSTALARRSRPLRAPLATSPRTRGFREPDGGCRPVPAARGAAGHIEHRTPEIRPRPAPESSGDRREQDKPAERARPRTIRPELPSKERRDRTRADCEASSSRSRPDGPGSAESRFRPPVRWYSSSKPCYVHRAVSAAAYPGGRTGCWEGCKCTRVRTWWRRTAEPSCGCG